MQVAAAAKARVVSQGTQLHTDSSGKADLLFILRGAVGLHEKPIPALMQRDQAHAQHPQQAQVQLQQNEITPQDGMSELSPGRKQISEGRQTPGFLGQLGKHKQQRQPSQVLDQQGQDQPMKQVLDARGYVLGLPALLQGPSCAETTLCCQTAVEVYVIPAALIQVCGYEAGSLLCMCVWWLMLQCHLGPL